jgi:hypothetical protein
MTDINFVRRYCIYEKIKAQEFINKFLHGDGAVHLSNEERRQQMIDDRIDRAILYKYNLEGILDVIDSDISTINPKLLKDMENIPVEELSVNYSQAEEAKK